MCKRNTENFRYLHTRPKEKEDSFRTEPERLREPFSLFSRKFFFSYFINLTSNLHMFLVLWCTFSLNMDNNDDIFYTFLLFVSLDLDCAAFVGLHSIVEL